MNYFGRSEGASGQKQLLRDHLRNVAALTGRFAEAAGLPRELGEWAGWLHDVGKYSDEFQRHLALQDQTFVEHAAHGAAVALRANAVDCAFAVNAHHSGLSTPSSLRELMRRNDNTAGLASPERVADRALRFIERAHGDSVPAGAPAASVPERGSELRFELRTRLLLSCLADADRLDAEAWMSQWHPYLRTTVEELNPTMRLDRTLAYVAGLGAGRPPSDVSAARAEVMQASLAAAQTAPGFFSMTVPTGGGKTLASLAFALAHAQAHGMRRVIFVVPFLTVIEQNAAVIRSAVGETGHGSAVLEHHSNVTTPGDARSDGQTARAVRQRLLAENWDAPIIMTTAVQFFESLFSDHPTQVRKIHNIANSVVIFDEAQTFPPGLLRPLVGMLRQLVEEYRCTVVFCTATQPALTNDVRGSDGPEALLAPGSVREIAPDPAGLFARLKRVEVEWPGAETTPLAAVAESMAGATRALAVVNTKRQARELYNRLLAHDPRAIHLSTRMCAAHRREQVAEIRRRLDAQQPCLVASTQLVEAGVDVDFPAVWRAFGPLDSIGQAAGRCNREGIATKPGRVVVFRPEDDAMPGGVYRLATGVTEGMLKAGNGVIDIHTPASFTSYFVGLYNASDLDRRRIVEARRALDYPAVAQRFRLIDDITTGVLVPYGEGADWIARLLGGEEFGRSQFRQMQPFMVSLYSTELEQGLASGAISVEGDAGVHVLRGSYSAALGLVLPGDDPLKD